MNWGFFDRFLAKPDRDCVKVQSLIDWTSGGGFYALERQICYQSDIVRSAIRPKVRAIGKDGWKTYTAKRIKPDGAKDIKVNPEPYIRFLLEEQNPRI